MAKSIREKFPSLKDEFYIVFSGTFVKWNNEFGSVFVFIDALEKHCLDKQKVKDAIEKLGYLPSVKKELKKELGL